MHYEKCIKNEKKLQKDLEKMSSQKRNFLIRVLISGKKNQQKNSFYTWILRLMFNKQTKKKAIF